MNDRDIGMSADFGRPDDDGRQTLEDAIEEAKQSFWDRMGTEAQDAFEDYVTYDAGDDNEIINVYLSRGNAPNALLSEEQVAPYGDDDGDEFEYEEHD